MYVKHLTQLSTYSTIWVEYPLPAEVNQIDKGREVFDLIRQKMGCGVRGGQDMGHVLRSLTDKEEGVMNQGATE